MIHNGVVATARKLVGGSSEVRPAFLNQKHQIGICVIILLYQSYTVGGGGRGCFLAITFFTWELREFSVSLCGGGRVSVGSVLCDRDIFVPFSEVT